MEGGSNDGQIQRDEEVAKEEVSTVRVERSKAYVLQRSVFPAGVHDVYGVRLVDSETLTLSVHFLSGPFLIHSSTVIDLSSKAHSSLGQPRPSSATDCTITSPIIKASGPPITVCRVVILSERLLCSWQQMTRTPL